MKVRMTYHKRPSSTKIIVSMVALCAMVLFLSLAMYAKEERSDDMAVQELIPDSDVLLVDIRDTLNDKGSSCTNEVLSFFDDRAVINHWSFRKPYSSSVNLWKLTDAQIRNLRCGFTPKKIGSYTSLPDVMDGDMNGWTYTRPFGGTTSPYRVGDYVGYYADAQPMVSNFHVPSRVSNKETSNIQAAALVGAQQDGKSVSLADLGDLAEYYSAVYVKQVSGTQSRRYTGYKVSGGTFGVEIPVSDLSTGDWTVYPFLAQNEMPDTTDVTNAYYTIPNLNPATVSIVASNFTIGVRATRRLGGTKAVDYTITITNASSAVTWTTNAWRLRFFGNEFADTMESGEMSGSLSSPITVAANTTTTITGAITGVNTTMWEQPVMVLWVSFNTGTYIDSGAVVQNAQE